MSSRQVRARHSYNSNLDATKLSLWVLIDKLDHQDHADRRILRALAAGLITGHPYPAG